MSDICPKIGISIKVKHIQEKYIYYEVFLFNHQKQNVGYLLRFYFEYFLIYSFGQHFNEISHCATAAAAATRGWNLGIYFAIVLMCACPPLSVNNRHGMRYKGVLYRIPCLNQNVYGIQFEFTNSQLYVYVRVYGEDV